MTCQEISVNIDNSGVQGRCPKYPVGVATQFVSDDDVRACRPLIGEPRCVVWPFAGIVFAIVRLIACRVLLRGGTPAAAELKKFSHSCVVSPRRVSTESGGSDVFLSGVPVDVRPQRAI